MMKLEGITFTLPQLAGADEVTAICCRPKKEWDAKTNSYTDKTIGSIITVVAPKRSYEKFDVTILGADLSSEFKEGTEGFPVSFTGFKASFYRSFKDNEYYLSAVADDMILI